MAGTSDREGFRQGQGSVLAVRVALGAAGVFYFSMSGPIGVPRAKMNSRAVFGVARAAGAGTGR